jgi:hypothetical protein
MLRHTGAFQSIPPSPSFRKRMGMTQANANELRFVGIKIRRAILRKNGEDFVPAFGNRRASLIRAYRAGL